ncbi:MAG: hypothetical protein WDW38_003961 [Sanguina aurantia]
MPESSKATLIVVLHTLAAALPCLKKLSLGKGCEESAMHVFGTHCPELSSLELDICQIPATVMQHVNRHLPCLTHVRLRADKTVTGNQGCTGTYNAPAAYMAHPQQCALLGVLSVDVDGGEVISMPDLYGRLPAGLEEHSCNCSVAGNAMPMRFSYGLRRLITLQGLGRESLPLFLEAHRQLQELTILDWAPNAPVELLGGAQSDTGPKTYENPLKARIAAGFKLTCQRVAMTGPSEEVADALTWLPPLPSVTNVRLHLDGTHHGECLQQLARVFPNLETMYVQDGELMFESDAPGSDAELLRPLSVCKGLKNLDVFMQMSFTTEGLLQMCQSLPSLLFIKYMACAHVDHALLASLMAASKPNTQVHTYLASEFYVSEDSYDDDDMDSEDDMMSGSQ